MDEFAEQVIARVQAARAALKKAAGSADSFGLQEALDELEDAWRSARAAGVVVPPVGGATSDEGAGS